MQDIYRLVAGDHNRYQQDFLDHQYSGIDLLKNGWKVPLTRREIQVILQMDLPHARTGQVNAAVGQTDIFINDMKQGDLLIMYHAASDRFIPGTILSEARFDARRDTPVYRDMAWLPQASWIAKRDLSFEFNSCIAVSSLLVKLLPDHQKEIEQHLGGSA